MKTPPRVYRRTRGSRALAAGGSALFGALCVHTLLEPPASGALQGLLVCGGLLLLSLALVVINFGDRLEVVGEGVRFRNLWRERMGLGAPRLLRWEDMEEVRNLGRGGARLLSAPAFVVRSRAGRRYVFDSLERLEEIEALVRERLARPPGSLPRAAP